MVRYAIQHVTAPNDTNGNPRRLYLVTPLDGKAPTAYLEGYHGVQAIPEEVREPGAHLWLEPMYVQPGTYKRLAREYRGVVTLRSLYREVCAGL